MTVATPKGVSMSPSSAGASPVVPISFGSEASIEPARSQSLRMIPHNTTAIADLMIAKPKVVTPKVHARVDVWFAPA